MNVAVYIYRLEPPNRQPVDAEFRRFPIILFLLLMRDGIVQRLPGGGRWRFLILDKTVERPVPPFSLSLSLRSFIVPPPPFVGGGRLDARNHESSTQRWHRETGEEATRLPFRRPLRNHPDPIFIAAPLAFLFRFTCRPLVIDLNSSSLHSFSRFGNVYPAWLEKFFLFFN